MEINRVQGQVASFAAAIVFLLQISPIQAGGQRDAPGATTQGSRVPGFVTPSTLDADGKPIEVTFTKWVKVVDGVSLLDGFTGGDVVGVFAGEVFRSQTSYDGRIRLLDAMYGVQAGDRSFAAVIRGGRNNNPGDAVLDGVILDGWRTGARVHVEFQTKPAPSPTASACDGAPPGLTCFQGIIQIARTPKD
jgi:hypothetical protein